MWGRRATGRTTGGRIDERTLSYPSDHRRAWPGNVHAQRGTGSILLALPWTFVCLLLSASVLLLPDVRSAGGERAQAARQARRRSAFYAQAVAAGQGKAASQASRE